MKLDPRKFSQEAYDALTKLHEKIDSKDHKKASSLVQGLVTYISTWGLYRLSGDAQKFLGRDRQGTDYKGVVYQLFLTRLAAFSIVKFDAERADGLINMPLDQYAAVNRLAIQLAREWAFWAPAVLGEGENM